MQRHHPVLTKPVVDFTVISGVMLACKTCSVAIIFLPLKHADVKSGSPICPWFCDAFLEIATLQWLNALFLSIAPGEARKLTRKWRSPQVFLSKLRSHAPRQQVGRNYCEHLVWSDLHPLKTNLSYPGAWSLLRLIWRVLHVNRAGYAMRIGLISLVRQDSG